MTTMLETLLLYLEESELPVEDWESQQVRGEETFIKYFSLPFYY